MFGYRLEDTTEGSILRLDGELTVNSAIELKSAFLESMKKGIPIAIDLSGVTEVDASGFQLLWSASKTEVFSNPGYAFFRSLPDDRKRDLSDRGYPLNGETMCNGVKGEILGREER